MKGACNSVLHGQTIENNDFMIAALTHGHVLDVHALRSNGVKFTGIWLKEATGSLALAFMV